MNQPDFLNKNSNDEKTIPGTQRWLTRLNMIVERNVENAEMNNKKLAERLEVSERDLFRKVKQLTGLSPQKYLRQFRLKKAMHNLKTGKIRTVKEAAHASGYTNVSYFIIQFEKEFGNRPFQVLKEFGWR